jgi:DNA-binding CsgD family transcriptional regulator
MTDLIFIADFVIAIGAIVAAILLLQQILKIHDIDWVKSYQYYLILVAVYGIFTIIGSVFTQNILTMMEVDAVKVQTIALLFPLLGIPIIYTAWYLFIKACREITLSQPKMVFTFIYFGILTLLFLFYGFQINNQAKESAFHVQQLIEPFKLAIIGVRVITLLFAVIPLFSNLKKLDPRFKKQFVVGSISIYLSIQAFILILFYFAYSNPIILFIFLFLYFGGEFIPVLLTYVYIKENNILFVEQNAKSDSWLTFLEKYQISSRESEIIEHICMGKSNREISDALFITLQTVKDHIYNIFIKTGIKNRVQLSNLANNYRD